MAVEAEYDLIVIGSGPGGQRAALAAAKLGKTVAVIEHRQMLGGVCVNTGTIPSKTLREAVMYLTGMNQRELYGASYRVKEKITPADLQERTAHVVKREIDVIRDQFTRNRIDLHTGHGSFTDANTVTIEGPVGAEQRTLTEKFIVIATGTTPRRPEGVDFDQERVLDSDEIVNLDFIPTSMVVVGAGVIGIEYASIFAALGSKVTVVEKRDTMLDFCDPEVVEALRFHLRDSAVTFRFGEEVTGVEVSKTGAGLATDDRGRIEVDEQFRTSVKHIFAVGDVIGFPALAAASMDQGRLAAYHAFEEPAHDMTVLQSIGIYSIPEVSFVGATESDLTAKSRPYEFGVSRYRELARGQIAGDSYGMLKLLVSTEDHKLLGVHIFGTAATELVHIGQAVMGCDGTVEYLVDAVLNYPTFSEAYKVAALDVMNKIRAVRTFHAESTSGADD